MSTPDLLSPPRQATLNCAGAVNAALARVLRELPEVLVYGEDVGKPGGVFGVTRGLRKQFGDRVFDTPISESAILGSALGAAMFGRRPVVEIMWSDFTLVALDQIINQIANTRYVSAGRLAAPLVIRTQQGQAPGSCAQHSQCLESIFLHTPGLRVAMPSTAQDAHDVLIDAVHSDDPVLVIENRTLYAGPKVVVDLDHAPQPLGGSRRRRHGDDLTIVTWGVMTRTAEAAADALSDDGLSVDVIELVWLNPLDEATIFERVETTGRLLVLHEANVTGGFGAEIVARVVESGVAVDAVRRLGLSDVPVPAAPHLAAAVLPSVGQVVTAARTMISDRRRAPSR